MNLNFRCPQASGTDDANRFRSQRALGRPRGGLGKRDLGRSHDDKIPADARVPLPARELSHCPRPPSSCSPSGGPGAGAAVSKSRPIPSAGQNGDPGHRAGQALGACDREVNPEVDRRLHQAGVAAEAQHEPRVELKPQQPHSNKKEEQAEEIKFNILFNLTDPKYRFGI